MISQKSLILFVVAARERCVWEPPCSCRVFVDPPGGSFGLDAIDRGYA